MSMLDILGLKYVSHRTLCVLVLFKYMIFWILMTPSSIVLFQNAEPKTAKSGKFL